MFRIITAESEFEKKLPEVSSASMTSHAKSIMFIGAVPVFIRHRSADYNYTIISTKNINQAKDLLLSGNFKDRKYLPEAIFCDLKTGEHAIKNLAAFLLLVKEFNTIPFIITGAESEIAEFDIENFQGIDDMINRNSSFDDLIDKIKLLKRYKSFKSRYPYRPAVSVNDEKYTFQNIAGRLIDITLSLLLLTILLPLFLLIAIAIKFDSRGSVFYVSLRAGKGYRVFNFYKFRTMVANADKKMDQIKHLNQYSASETSKDIFVKINNDPRITRLGKFLRNTSLDELPQLINVLIGDMSIVGNRPLPLYEASALTTDEYAERFLAPAGMTGLWQTNGRGHEKMSAEERINMDIDYAKKHSLMFDLYILLRTPRGLMQKTNV
jgi:lipopolysaccharide/colanic/teichoic acid biosynthesis glycosyltransferase